MKPNHEAHARNITFALLRIVAGFLVAQHGTQKLFGWLGGTAVPAYASQMGVAGIIEFFGGLLVLLGLFTRGAAFLISGELAVAYFIAHLPRGFWPIMNKGELAVIYSFVFLFFTAHGGGPYSLDGVLRRGPAPDVTPGEPTAPRRYGA